LCTDAGVGVVVEIKSPSLYPGMVEKVVALIGEMRGRGAENIWCISFDHAAIRQVRSLDAGIPLGYLYEYFEQEFVQPDDTIQAYCPYFRTALAHPEQVAKAHELGKFVFVYTVNEEDDMRQLATASIDGMVSDRPSLLKRVFAN